MESKKRDIWSDREIREMLNIVKEDHIMKLIDGKTKRNKNIFLNIAEKMKVKHFLKTDAQIRTKFKNLKSDFYKTKRANNKSGAKRQTMEHFDLLDDIFGHRPAVEAVGIDTTEMDFEDLVDEVNEEDEAEFDFTPNNEFILIEDESESSASTSKAEAFKRKRKNSYQKVVETFTKEWNESQEQMLEKIREQDEHLVDYQVQKQKEMMEENQKAVKEMLEEDRKETAKMMQNFLDAMQPPQQYMFQPPKFLYRQQPSPSPVPLPVPVPIPKKFPPENE